MSWRSSPFVVQVDKDADEIFTTEIVPVVKRVVDSKQPVTTEQLRALWKTAYAHGFYDCFVRLENSGMLRKK